MRLFIFLTLITLSLLGCETTTTPPGHDTVVQTNQPMASSQQNHNPNVTAAKMMSPLM
jgi:hypothetical protein